MGLRVAIFALAFTVGAVAFRAPSTASAEEGRQRLGDAKWVTGADSWPMSRGNPRRTGVSASKLPEKPVRVWRFQGPKAFEAEAAISDGVVYAGTVAGHLYAIDLASGQSKWETTLTGGLNAGPCVHEGRLYVAQDDGFVASLDRETGKTIWSFETGSETFSAPVWHEGRVLAGSYDQSLYCLDATSGTLVWKYETNGPVHCAPTLDGEGRRAYIAGCDHMLRAIDATSGTLVWEREMESFSAANPAVFGDALYVCHFGAKVFAANAQDGKPIWEFASKSSEYPFYASCAVTAKRVVAAGRDKNVYCLDRESGKQIWEFTAKGEVDASPVVADGRVWVGSKGGIFYALDLATGGQTWQYAAGPPITASAAVASGRLVVGDASGALYCFGRQEKRKE
ncbi:MAG TPA: PQQ-binding-like beta-propeller repeat protein [Sumerlaeia bacterium]|nr:PQQ-binding-like beta-propeller repeat protein [Sumerlaeia bacterium]